MWGDDMRFEWTKKYLQLFCLISCLFIYFKNAQTIMDAVKDGLLLCYNVIIPSLFIFLIICSILSETGCCEFMAIPFMPYFRLLNINNKRIVSYCILAILGGFATGGIMLNKITGEYQCDSNTLGILSILMSGNSPSFVILAVGVHYLNNLYLGIILYLSIMISSFITAFFMSFLYKPYSINATKNHLVVTNNSNNSIRNSVYSILNICGAVIMSITLCKVFNLYTTNSFILLIFSAFTEVTTACETVYSNYGANIYLLLLTLVIFPFSAYLQMKSVGDNNTFNFKILIFSRLIHIPISVLLLRIALNIFPLASNVYANGDISINTYWNKPQLSLCLLIISIMFTAILDKKSKVFTKRVK